MKITAIKQQVKRQGRYSIFVEGKYAFSLSDTALIESKLTSGQELTKEQIGEFKQLSADDKLYNNALNYALLRPRSVWEVEQYLRRKKCSPTLSQEILNKLSKLDMLNDEAFAKSWVNNRRLLRPTSRRRLLQELHAKHVNEDIARQAIENEAIDERVALVALIARKKKQARYQDKQKLMQYLAGQGFNYGDIKAALEEADESSD